MFVSSISVFAQNDTTFMNMSPKEGIFKAMEYYGIHHQDIVYAQAVIETGNFNSKGCKVKNNLFGIMHGTRLKSYENWWDSVRDYKLRIQNRHRKGEDYYIFLKRIRYASNPNYTKHLKRCKR